MAAAGEDFPSAARVARWLREVRAGSREALGVLLDRYRPYLLAVANQRLEEALQSKLGGSDLVQETFLEAQRDFEQFQGKTPEEWRRWLRKLLLNNVANSIRHYRATGKREVAREVPLGDAPGLAATLGTHETPSGILRQGEETEALRNGLEQLPAHYRDIIHMRNYERRSFEEIGLHLGKTAEAARKLWGRAIEHLYQLMRSEDDPG